MGDGTASTPGALRAQASDGGETPRPAPRSFASPSARPGGPDPLRRLRLALRFALREMRGGLSGFLIFVTCIALGVAAIGGVNSVARAIGAGVANGRAHLP